MSPKDPKAKMLYPPAYTSSRNSTIGMLSLRFVLICSE